MDQFITTIVQFLAATGFAALFWAIGWKFRLGTYKQVLAVFLLNTLGIIVIDLFLILNFDVETMGFLSIFPFVFSVITIILLNNLEYNIYLILWDRLNNKVFKEIEFSLVEKAITEKNEDDFFNWINIQNNDCINAWVISRRHLNYQNRSWGDKYFKKWLLNNSNKINHN